MVGDLKEISAGAAVGPATSVTAIYDYRDSQASLWGTNDIVGRSLVLMSQPDLGAKTATSTWTVDNGNSGTILACCNIVLSEADNLGITQSGTPTTCAIDD